ncbi:MAG: amino acid ABC transporter permease [Fuscovulum sp.]|nr:MAG: amino acid ABC transporter permease [Fuscovulum sp.]
MKITLPYSGLQWSDLWFVLEGIGNTVLLTVIAATIGTIIGLALGWARGESKTARWAFAPIIDVVRSVPLIIQLILASSFFAMAGGEASPLVAGCVVLSLYMGVLTSELVRAGLASVHITLRRAARSLGMSYWQELRHVSAPLALRAVFPGWVGTLIALTKDTALVGVLGYVELMRATQILINRTNEALLILTGAGLFYFLICYPISRYCRRLEKAMNHD